MRVKIHSKCKNVFKTAWVFSNKLGRKYLTERKDFSPMFDIFMYQDDCYILSKNN